MKSSALAVLSAVLLLPALSKAEQPRYGTQCLGYAKATFKENDAVYTALSQARLAERDIEVNRYDAPVGTQHISTEVTLSIHSRQERLGTLLCLFDGDRPLYARYLPD
jgi:hypothetical protein